MPGCLDRPERDDLSRQVSFAGGFDGNDVSDGYVGRTQPQPSRRMSSVGLSPDMERYSVYWWVLIGTVFQRNPAVSVMFAGTVAQKANHKIRRFAYSSTQSWDARDKLASEVCPPARRQCRH
jgi:hypothetical protein